jgi:prepilin-type N-terminal cleavage/methylation domain-containing protein
MSKTASRRAGFTLIEVLVALVIIALLVAAVFPTLTKQIDDAEPTRLANDLANIRTGLETFQVNVRETPSDLEDLTIAIAATDSILGGGGTFQNKHLTRWKGPYIDAAVTSVTTTDTVITTGFGSGIINGLKACNASVASACDLASGNFAAILLRNMTAAEWATVNDLIDGENETNSTTAGKWRGVTSTTVTLMDSVFYYAVPLGN